MGDSKAAWKWRAWPRIKLWHVLCGMLWYCVLVCVFLFAVFVEIANVLGGMMPIAMAILSLVCTITILVLLRFVKDALSQGSSDERNQN